MEMAFNEALLAEEDVPVGCVIVQDRKLLAAGETKKKIAKIQLITPRLLLYAKLLQYLKAGVCRAPLSIQHLNPAHVC